MKTTKPSRPTRAAAHQVIPNRLRIRIGAALQKHRIAAGLTQAELAKHADLSLKYIGEIERGEANTTLEVLERLSMAISWDPTDAFEGLREPISEGVRLMLIEMLSGVVEILQQAVRWLKALAPIHTRLPGNDVVDVPSVESGTIRKPRLLRRLLGPKE